MSKIPHWKVKCIFIHTVRVWGQWRRLLQACCHFGPLCVRLVPVHTSVEYSSCHRLNMNRPQVCSAWLYSFRDIRQKQRSSRNWNMDCVISWNMNIWMMNLSFFLILSKSIWTRLVLWSKSYHQTVKWGLWGNELSSFLPTSPKSNISDGMRVCVEWVCFLHKQSLSVWYSNMLTLYYVHLVQENSLYI